MAGEIKRMIDVIIKKNANGNVVLENSTKTKLLIKGINPAKYDLNSVDDAAIIEKLKIFAKGLNINI